MAENTPNEELYGLLGRNIAYSLSPAMHNAAFEHFEIRAEYRIFDVTPENLGDFIKEELLSGKVEGLNITVPYKTDVMVFLENFPGAKVSLTPFPRISGAINTLRRTGDSLELHNTDGEGFYASLREDAGMDPSGKNIFILGAGGAGRVIALYLAGLGGDAPRRIDVFDIDKERLFSLKDTVGRYRGSGILDVHVETRSDLLGIGNADLVVNATPIGTREGDTAPIDDGIVGELRKKCVIYDLVYARETELVKTARSKGLRAFNGEGMLANQGALAFSLWTGKPFDEVKPVMRAALMRELNR
ncbi:MAG: shikimate dehydrogenase [Candidatus Omnitrophica bacterium]|nr:shikimate dehydrogenase [Candidatus Omnitrophota bacterium]